MYALMLSEDGGGVDNAQFGAPERHFWLLSFQCKTFPLPFAIDLTRNVTEFLRLHSHGVVSATEG